MDERVMLRIGTASLALGLVIAVIFEALHPARENPNDDPQVFAEYAQSGDWITIHLGQLAGALLLIVGLALALHESVGVSVQEQRKVPLDREKLGLLRTK